MHLKPIQPFSPNFDGHAVDELIVRLRLTRYPNPETVEDWSQGVPLSYQQELVDYWVNNYDLSRVPRRLNKFENFKTEINDLNIHFIHHRSPHTSAKPLLITHGWPGSVLEYLDLIEPLTEPTKHGGSVEDAFHVILPALPGFGFSDKPRCPGVGVPKIAEMWEELMARLGYETYYAHGGDWGSIVTQAILMQSETRCAAGHCTLPLVVPDISTMENPLPDEIDAIASFQFYNDWDSGYSKQQSTRPQTVGYGLADSPAGQMAWIVEKFAFWMDCERNGIRHPENVLSKDLLLDSVMMYWMTNSGASSARLYWESFNNTNLNPISRPVGLSVFPKEIMRTSERWARGRFEKLTYFNNQFDRGGHFAALETPVTLVDELRTWRSTT